jgi:hypothetical protein
MTHQLLAPPQTTDTTTAVAPVETVVAAILRDSRRDPQQYLEDSVTPHGGE